MVTAVSSWDLSGLAQRPGTRFGYLSSACKRLGGTYTSHTIIVLFVTLLILVGSTVQGKHDHSGHTVGFNWTPTILFARTLFLAHGHGEERTITVNVLGASRSPPTQNHCLIHLYVGRYLGVVHRKKGKVSFCFFGRLPKRINHAQHQK